MRDYTPEAEALFARFAQRHRLTFDVHSSAQVEVWWTFPEQQRLSVPIVLALQNNDELNFGVGSFWSYFFPFEKVAHIFEEAADAWVAGTVRVAPISLWTDALQLRRNGGWETIYRASRLLPSFRQRPTLQNCALGDRGEPRGG